MNETTHQAWGAGVKGCAVVLLLSLSALLAQLGYALWQLKMDVADAESGMPEMAQARQHLPVQARHLARLARAALDGAVIGEEFGSVRAQISTQVRQLLAQMDAGPELQARTPPLVSAWAEMETAAGRVYERLDVLRDMADRERQWFDQMEGFKARLDALVREMAASGAAASQVYLALHQLVLLDEMNGRVGRIRSGDERAALEAGELAQEAAAFARVLAGLQRGDAEMALRRLQGRRTRAALAQVTAQWESLHALLDGIVQQAPTRLLLHSAVLALERGADVVLELSAGLAQTSATPPLRASSESTRLWAALGTAVLALLSGMELWQALLRRRRDWNESAARRRLREQDAFAQLLDEMGALAEGDLTVKASFSEGAAGALADAINFISQQLGARIQTVVAAAMTVTDNAGQVRSKSVQLAQVTQYQCEELDAALAKLRQISACVDVLVAQMATEANLQAVHTCTHACADLAAMLETVHTVTTGLADEAAQAVVAVDVLAQSAASLGESAAGFVLPR